MNGPALALAVTDVVDQALDGTDDEPRTALRDALTRYYYLAVSARLPDDRARALRALDALDQLARTGGRPRKDRPSMDWNDDDALRKDIYAIMHRLRTLRDDPDLVADANDAVDAMMQRVGRSVQRGLTPDETTKLRHMAMRSNVESREIYEQVMSWRTGWPVEAVRAMRGKAAFRGQ